MDEPEHTDEVPEGAAVFPLIPAELGVHPLLLAVLHANVFLNGSTADVVHPVAADEAVDHQFAYLQRLDGADRRRLTEDLDVLRRFAREEKWPKQLLEYLKLFEDSCAAGGEGEVDETEDDEE